MSQASMKARILRSVAVNPSGCWNWTLSSTKSGYGQLMTYNPTTRKRKLLYAHRASFEAFRDRIPSGLTIDHLCKNKICVNPAHLEVVTRSENIKRADRAQRKTCERGHPKTPENYYRSPRAPFRSAQCRVCRKIRDQRRKYELANVV